MTKKHQESDSVRVGALNSDQCVVYILDPLDTSAPILHELSNTHNFEVRWFKTAQEIQKAQPWKGNPQAIYLLSDKCPKVSSLEIVYEIAEISEDTSPIWLLTDSLNANFREVSKLAGVVGWLSTPLKPKVFTSCLELVQNRELWRPPRGDTIRFNPKVGTLNMNWNGEELMIDGVMDEKAEFTRIPDIIPKGLKTVQCNWSGVLTLNIEGLKVWQEFVTSDTGKVFQFVFEKAPRMMREYWDSMPSAFGNNVTLTKPQPADSKAHNFNQDRTVEDNIRILLTEGRRPVISPNDSVCTLHEMYLGMLTTISRYALSELYLTQEAVLDLCSRMIARCSAVGRALPLTDITRTFDLPGRMPLIASMLALYEPLLRTLVGTIELLEAASANPLQGSKDKSQLEEWVNNACESNVTALPWQLKQLDPLKTAVKSNLNGDSLLSIVFQLIHTAITNNLSTIDATGVAAFKLAKFEGPSPQMLANLSSQLRRATIPDENLQSFRHECVLDWSSPNNPKAMAAEASKLLLGTAQEARRIGLVLDTHDTLQQIFDHRKLELERLIRGASKEEIQEHLKKQAVTVLEKKVIGLYFNELSGLADETTQLSGLQMFSAS